MKINENKIKVLEDIREIYSKISTIKSQTIIDIYSGKDINEDHLKIINSIKNILHEEK